ncbi:hypothetical protein [Qiania dongpingensis]|uniref:Uncharacterized protein n=1 Tax=Qiania dongpingensis TaxID=2763669 RepID=A0A7G9G354_9FIRM|nr:hypothetical protein [Qiania dongpingensis]QNM05236.1 hypothetical protein H9Q78_12435 [Qiania dongpingensis]
MSRKIKKFNKLSKLPLALLSFVLMAFFLASCMDSGKAPDTEKAEEETVVYMGRSLPVSKLSDETLEWLEWFNQMPEEAQLAINYVPYDISSLINEGSGSPEALETTDAP